MIGLRLILQKPKRGIRLALVLRLRLCRLIGLIGLQGLYLLIGQPSGVDIRLLDLVDFRLHSWDNLRLNPSTKVYKRIEKCYLLTLF